MISATDTSVCRFLLADYIYCYLGLFWCLKCIQFPSVCGFFSTASSICRVIFWQESVKLDRNGWCFSAPAFPKETAQTQEELYWIRQKGYVVQLCFSLWSSRSFWTLRSRAWRGQPPSSWGSLATGTQMHFPFELGGSIYDLSFNFIMKVLSLVCCFQLLLLLVIVFYCSFLIFLTCHYASRMSHFMGGKGGNQYYTETHNAAIMTSSHTYYRN